MKRLRNIIISAIVLLVVLGLGLFIYYRFFYDENKLSISEKEWIQTHKADVITFNIPNNLNVFGYNGSGVFFDYVNKLSDYANINIHKNAININEQKNNELGFVITEKVLSNSKLLYQDHYVLVSSDEEVVSELSNVIGSKIGTIGDISTNLKEYYKYNIEYITYESRGDLLNAFNKNEVKYIIVPKLEYLDSILSENKNIVHHFSDLVINYYLQLSNDEVFNGILTKYYNMWISESFEDIYYQSSYDLFIRNLKLTQAQTDALTNRIYTYGLVTNTPYQALHNSKKGGIILSYLEDFSKFSGVEFKYESYKNYEQLTKDFNNQKLDLIFNDYVINAGFHKISTNFNNKYYIISPLDKKLTLKNIKELVNDKVIVIGKSNLHQYLNNIKDLQLKTVSNEKELLKAVKNGDVIAIDAYNYDFNVNDVINNYSIRYTGYTNNNHSFKYIKDNDAFYKLFKSYVNSVDQNELLHGGLLSYRTADNARNIVAYVATYTLAILLGSVLVIVYVLFKKKRITIKTKLKKDDKLKYIDVLTSLKNRNYLNDQKEAWNQNTIYPQAIIMIDLNKIKYLNDTLGHGEGDLQIKSTANILIKTQLDNSEIMRTDGNEFIVYLVGYNEKQVLNYIKKLVKEFKDLPHEFGAAFGFSMILDDLKLIDDALNEAFIQMRENKENLEDKNED